MSMSVFDELEPKECFFAASYMVTTSISRFRKRWNQKFASNDNRSLF